MTTATPPAPTKVHVEVAGFAGYGEFHGYNNDCSADAELMARHPLDGSPLDAATLNLWWGEYWNTGHHTSGGATLAHIYWHITASAHKIDTTKCRVARYIGVDSVSLADLRTAIIAALTKGQTVIVYLGNAQALTYNERGVYGHFIALGGIDSDMGYLVGNGDDVNALGGKGVIPCRWYDWNMLAAAQINGMIALEKVPGSSSSGGANVAGIPTGWHDDGATLTASNGVQVVHGFREWVLAHPWDAGNTPMAAERIITTGSIEPGNASMGPGSRQDFRFSSLGWTAKTNVYQIATGQDIVALANQLVELQMQLTSAHTGLDNADAAIASLKQQLAAAQAAPKADPVAAACLAAMQAFKAALGEL